MRSLYNQYNSSTKPSSTAVVTRLSARPTTLLADLPEEIQQLILSFLEDQFIIRLSRLSKTYHKIITELPGSAILARGFFGKRHSHNAELLQMHGENMRKVQPGALTEKRLDLLEQGIKTRPFKTNVEIIAKKHLASAYDTLHTLQRHKQWITDNRARRTSFDPYANLSLKLLGKYLKKFFLDFAEPQVLNQKILLSILLMVLFAITVDTYGPIRGGLITLMFAGIFLFAAALGMAKADAVTASLMQNQLNDIENSLRALELNSTLMAATGENSAGTKEPVNRESPNPS